MWWLPLLVNVIAAARFGVAFFSRTGAAQLLALSTQGVYLYLSFFVSVYLSWVLKCEPSPRIRRIAWSFAALLASGTAGVLLSAESPVASVDVLKSAMEHNEAIDDECRGTRFLDAARCVSRVQRRPLPPLFTLSSSHVFEATVRFERFPDDLARYVQRAAQGDVRLLVDLYVFQIPVDFTVTLGDPSDTLQPAETNKHLLTSAQAAAFARQGRLVFRTQVPDGVAVPISPRAFWIRNPLMPLPYRKDAARFDDRPFPFPAGDTFLMTLQFETPAHVPLAVFF